MSGTEPSGLSELFPDAQEQGFDASTTGQGESDRGPSRRLGLAALVIAVVAVVGDLTGAGIGYTTLFADSLSDDRIGEIAAAIAVVLVIVGLDLVLALVALALGIAAAITRRGGRPGVIGAVIGGVLVIVHVLAIVWLVSLSNALY